MSEIDERLWMQVEAEAERQPLLTLGEARAVVHLLEVFSHSDGEGAELARHLSGMLARRLPAGDAVQTGVQPRPPLASRPPQADIVARF